MDFQLTPEQAQFRDSVLAFSQKHLAAGARERAHRADRTLDRFHALPLPVRIYIYASSAFGLATAVAYIFSLYPILDLTYYFILMAMFLPVAFLLTPAHKNEQRAGWAESCSC
jgi:hypothetical protein